MTIKAVLAALALAIAGTSLQAGVITFEDYTWDANNNYVSGGGLDWMRWSETTGESISSALADNSGWRLAGNTEMADLFNVFEFGKTDWSDDPLISQSHSEPFGSAADHSIFIDMFGATQFSLSCNDVNRRNRCYVEDNVFRQAGARYGSDANGNGYFNLARVQDDRLFIESDYSERFYGSSANLFAEHSTRDYESSSGNIGVALVRDTKPVSVNEPASLGLMVISLIGILLARRFRRNPHVQACC